MAAKKTLLVEGNDDKHVLCNICKERGIQPIDEVKSLEGVESLLESFPVRLKAGEDGDVVGIVIDADTNATARWQSLRDRLIKAGYPCVPDNPDPNGTILESPIGTLLPRAGIWIMPHNQTAGVLEDFLRFLVPVESALLAHTISSVATIPEGERRFSPLAETKAIIHTWLAWQKEPGKPLGTAIVARYLDPGVAEVDVLVSWINRLFFL